MRQFTNKTAIITGASRGIGREIALALAKEGANVVLAAKTTAPHDTLAGTIYSVADEVTSLGGKALPIKTDVRHDTEINDLIDLSVKTFGTIDIVINNAGAIYLTDSLSTDAKKFDLMHQINVRATYLVTRAAMPFLKKQGGHVINLSPPISLEPKWLAPHLAYTMSKYGMSMCTIGMAEEFKEHGVAVNSLWPKTLIYTAAITRLLGEEGEKHCRTPAIMADAALVILKKDPKSFFGQLLFDEEVLAGAGIKDLRSYDCTKNALLMPDLYV